jgi:predicted AlkP superfamily phosphohydrolase/phosphomutase
MPRPYPSPRALVIGIDGGDFAAVDPLVDRGLLPNLAALLRRSASASTTCTWPAHTAPGWSTFVSASQPGGHGIYQFFQTQDPDYRATVTTADRLGRSSVWDWLAAQGYSLGLVNVPMSHPPRDLPGYQVSWPLQQTMHYCRPRSLLGELARNGVHFQSDLATMFRGDYGYLEQAESTVAARARSMSYLLRTRPTDLAMVVFTEVDRVGHHYWHFTDPGHPRYQPAPADSGWDRALTRIYQAVDAAIGELLAVVDEDTSVLLVSDHGLGTGRHAFSVHAVLSGAGLLATRPATAGEPTASWFTENGRTVDFDRTLAYQPVPGSYGINLNLRGRQRAGLVEPAQRERLRQEVADLMLAVRLPAGGPLPGGPLSGSPVSGGPVFRDVIPSEVAYPGPHRAQAPDLLLVPADETVLATGQLTGPEWQPSWQTGLHRHAGMWLHSSPRIRPGRLSGPVRLVDTVPTLLTELGASWPSTVHGEPLTAVLAGGVDIPAPDPDLERAENGYSALVPVGAPAGADDYTSQRLREMGYI